MFPGGVDTSDLLYVPEQAFGRIKNYRIFSDDIFISVAGTLGIVGVVPPQLSGANLTENADRITNLKCDRDYLMYWLMSYPIQQAIESIRTVGAQPKLALGRIAKFLIALPPYASEQRTIATVLSDMDSLIASLDKLIAKKRDIKQAAMQKLLTGKQRLPGFSGKWEVKRLGEVGAFSKGKGLSKEDVNDVGRVPAIPYTAIYTDFNEIIEYDMIDNFTSSTETVFINTPHILIAGSSNMLENIGKVSAFNSYNEVAIGGDIILYKTIANVCFISYLLNTRAHRKRIISLSQGSTIRHVYSSTFADYEVELPQPKEQQAIAQLLTDIITEIESLEQKRNKYKMIKLGMIQELLTGRIRLA